MKNYISDFYGIGQAIASLVETYFSMSRATGRTTRMLSNIRDGDNIFFSNERQADRIRRILKNQGIKAKCYFLNPKRPEDIFMLPTPDGRSIFDHSWIEEYYRNAINRASREIEELERESSGYGEAHIKTKEKATIGDALIELNDFLRQNRNEL